MKDETTWLPARDGGAKRSRGERCGQQVTCAPRRADWLGLHSTATNMPDRVVVQRRRWQLQFIDDLTFIIGSITDKSGAATPSISRYRPQSFRPSRGRMSNGR